MNHTSSPLVFYNGCNYIGSTAEFVSFAARVFAFKMAPNAGGDAAAAPAEFDAWLKSSQPRTFCFMDMGAEGAAPLGRVIVELFDDMCPKTCENFRGICNGTDSEGQTLSYAGTPIHRIVKGGWIQSGGACGSFCGVNQRAAYKT